MCVKRFSLAKASFRNEPSHQDLHCLSCTFDFRLISLFASVDMFKVKDGIVHSSNAEMKGLKRKRTSSFETTILANTMLFFLYSGLNSRYF